MKIADLKQFGGEEVVEKKIEKGVESKGRGLGAGAWRFYVIKKEVKID